MRGELQWRQGEWNKPPTIQRYTSQHLQTPSFDIVVIETPSGRKKKYTFCVYRSLFLWDVEQNCIWNVLNPSALASIDTGMTNATEQDSNRRQVESLKTSLSECPTHWAKQIIDFIRNVLPLLAWYWFCNSLCLPATVRNALFLSNYCRECGSSVAGLVLAGPCCFCYSSQSEGQPLCTPRLFKGYELNHVAIMLLKWIFSKHSEVPSAEAPWLSPSTGASCLWDH